MKKLIVTADDVGLHPAMTEGAIRAYAEGIVTACSVVANGAAFEEAVDRLHHHNSLAFGVHLTFVGGETPVLPAGAVKTLVTRDGVFPASYTAFVARYFSGRIDVLELERELRAQVERVLATGLRIVHFNSHQHLHLLPDIFELVVRLAIEYRVPYVRVVNDFGGRGGFFRRASIAGLNRFGKRASRWLAAHHFTSSRRGRSVPFSNTRTAGVTEAGALDAEALRRLIRGVEDGLTELVVHPGSDDEALAPHYRWNYRWQRELEALCDAGVRKEIADCGIDLMSPLRIAGFSKNV